MNIKNYRWIRCPLCKKKTKTKVYKETTLLRFPLYCTRCRSETLIDVVNYKMSKSYEPDA